MATFSISISIEVEADDYYEAYEIEKSISEFLQGHDAVVQVYGIDVEQTSEDEE